MVKGEYILFGGLIRLTNSSTIIPFSTVTIPTEHGWNSVAVSKSMAVNVKLIFDLGLTIFDPSDSEQAKHFRFTKILSIIPVQSIC